MRDNHKCSKWCGCTLEERFWSRIDRRSFGECWPWLRSTSAGGYGKIWLRPGDLPEVEARQLVDAHRLAYRLLVGRWPTLNALHGCDNPACCNALNEAHIHDGSQAQNCQEMRERGRWALVNKLSGENHPRARYTDAQVAEFRRLRALVPSTAELARQLGVPSSTLRNIMLGRRVAP